MLLTTVKRRLTCVDTFSEWLWLGYIVLLIVHLFNATTKCVTKVTIKFIAFDFEIPSLIFSLPVSERCVPHKSH